MLPPTFSKDVLKKAKYVECSFEGTVPAIVNEIKTKLGANVGGNHAVTVDNIIIFAKPPEAKDIFFWAHEMQHVVQYQKMGIEKLSYN